MSVDLSGMGAAVYLNTSGGSGKDAWNRRDLYAVFKWVKDAYLWANDPARAPWKPEQFEIVALRQDNRRIVGITGHGNAILESLRAAESRKEVSS